MSEVLPLRSDFTTLLSSSDSGTTRTIDRLLPAIYEELEVLARRQLAREPVGHTLETSALVHEAYLKLVDDAQVTRKGRSYFFAAAARAMRQVLVDHARARRRKRRGGGDVREHPETTRIEADDVAAELLDLDRALQELAKLNPRYASVVECRFFAGLSVEETAEALDISQRTVKYDWAIARAWLFAELRQ